MPEFNMWLLFQTSLFVGVCEVKKDILLGTHKGAGQYASVNFIPSSASLSRFGVLTNSFP
jgi:hypothetical protein